MSLMYALCMYSAFFQLICACGTQERCFKGNCHLACGMPKSISPVVRRKEECKYNLRLKEKCIFVLIIIRPFREKTCFPSASSPKEADCSGPSSNLWTTKIHIR